MNLEDQLRLFSSFSTQQSHYCQVSEVGPYILRLETKSNQKQKITLGFSALVHGNEFLGLPILNSLIQSILNGDIQVNYDIYFGLGNIPAAFANKRFIEEDMNRCFGKIGHTSEAKRAYELETLMLNHCDFLVDIHQTIFTSEKPFFIFQYSSERCLSIMEKWNTDIPVILQEAQLGENTGLCTDEYVRSRGGFGTALELGQLGTENHFDLGLEICRRVLKNTTSEMVTSKEILEPLKFEVLKLSASAYKVKDSSYKLDEGWKNLSYFEKGQRLGVSDAGEILAPVSGFMLFPRYRSLSAGQELFYYCTSIFKKNNDLTEKEILQKRV